MCLCIPLDVCDLTAGTELTSCYSVSSKAYRFFFIKCVEIAYFEGCNLNHIK